MTTKPYALRYLRIAQTDLAEIKRFNERFSAKYQSEILARLQSCCETLITTPYLYPEYEYNPAYRKMVVEDYIVFYKVSDKPRRVSIYRILHGRRNIASIMNGRR